MTTENSLKKEARNLVVLIGLALGTLGYLAKDASACPYTFSSFEDNHFTIDVIDKGKKIDYISFYPDSSNDVPDMKKYLIDGNDSRDDNGWKTSSNGKKLSKTFDFSSEVDLAELMRNPVSSFIDVYGKGKHLGRIAVALPNIDWDFVNNGYGNHNGNSHGNGSGFDNDNKPEAPVPEPSSLLLMGTSLAGILAYGRKKRMNTP